MEVIRILNITNGESVGELKYFVVTENNDKYKVYSVTKEEYFTLSEGNQYEGG